MYLLYSASLYTGEEDLLNYKCLDCYINFISGWVREVLVKMFDKKRVVLDKVKIVQLCNICNNGLRCTMNAVESFREMREKLLTPWIIAEESGKVIAAHCDCMVGLGESCTHVASLLFAVEREVRIRDSMNVTQKKAYCVIPTCVKEVQYAPVQEIRYRG